MCLFIAAEPEERKHHGQTGIYEDNGARELELNNGDEIQIGNRRCLFVEETHTTASADIINEPDNADRDQIDTVIPHTDDQFLPENEIRDSRVLRVDYEKLRITHELQRDIGMERNLDCILDRILDRTFDFLNCERGCVLLVDKKGKLKPTAIKTRKPDEKFVISTTLLKQVREDKVGVITSDALTDRRFYKADSIIAQNIRSSMAVPLLYRNELLGVMVIDSSEAVNAYIEKDLNLLSNIANQTAQFIKNAEMTQKIEREAITREHFQRLLSPNLAELVVSGELKVEKGGTVHYATVLFADIRGFTAMSENIPAPEVLQMLNEFFEVMVDIVFHYEGTVDKFVGDMIMVFWGAPVAHDDDPERAVRAALDMQNALVGFNQDRAKRGQPPIRIGIGINTGQLVAGYIGSTRTMSYSVIGDAVNVGARLCSAAEANQTIISEVTRRQVENLFEMDELPPLHAKGKSEPLLVFDVLNSIDTH